MEQAAMEVWDIHYRQESQVVSPGTVLLRHL